MKYYLSPSILSADFAHLGDDIAATEKGGTQYLHYDVMDGMFVPSISFGMPVLKSVRKITDLVLDVHLMIEDPDRYIDEFVKKYANTEKVFEWIICTWGGINKARFDVNTISNYAKMYSNSNSSNCGGNRQSGTCEHSGCGCTSR